MQGRFPNLPAERQLQSAFAAYNCGSNNVATPDTADQKTTGTDYSNDVWVRAAYYVARWPAAGG